MGAVLLHGFPCGSSTGPSPCTQACKLPMSRSLLVGFLGAAMPHRLPKAGLDVGVKISVSGVLLQEDALQARTSAVCNTSAHLHWSRVVALWSLASHLKEEPFPTWPRTHPSTHPATHPRSLPQTITERESCSGSRKQSSGFGAEM